MYSNTKVIERPVLSDVRPIRVADFVVNIATSGRPELLRRTLESLKECEEPVGYRETVVVENGPRGGAEAVVRAARSWLNVRY